MARSYDENGNIVHTGAALFTRFRHDYLDRIVEARTVPALDSTTGVPVGDEFSDDFSAGLAPAWKLRKSTTGGLRSALWSWNASDYWWVYALSTVAAIIGY